MPIFKPPPPKSVEKKLTPAQFVENSIRHTKDPNADAAELKETKQTAEVSILHATNILLVRIGDRAYAIGPGESPLPLDIKVITQKAVDKWQARTKLDYLKGYFSSFDCTEFMHACDVPVTREAARNAVEKAGLVEEINERISFLSDDEKERVLVRFGLKEAPPKIEATSSLEAIEQFLMRNLDSRNRDALQQVQEKFKENPIYTEEERAAKYRLHQIGTYVLLMHEKRLGPDAGYPVPMETALQMYKQEEGALKNGFKARVDEKLKLFSELRKGLDSLAELGKTRPLSRELRVCIAQLPTVINEREKRAAEHIGKQDHDNALITLETQRGDYRFSSDFQPLAKSSEALRAEFQAMLKESDEGLVAVDAKLKDIAELLGKANGIKASMEGKLVKFAIKDYVEGIMTDLAYREKVMKERREEGRFEAKMADLKWNELRYYHYGHNEFEGEPDEKHTLAALKQILEELGERVIPADIKENEEKCAAVDAKLAEIVELIEKAKELQASIDEWVKPSIRTTLSEILEDLPERERLMGELRLHDRFEAEFADMHYKAIQFWSTHEGFEGKPDEEHTLATIRKKLEEISGELKKEEQGKGG